ncbi:MULTISPECIES: Rha family transcriptional regulator [Fusobacterium]|jgi:possible bacteriophage antirepressor|uniref:Rha family transcriptional regulator n=1 Tax=Fusobacterium TaxID=848 RepID=UPI00044A25B0|nr:MULTISPECIES: Rha family transcriptional regulator [Fusobacterium]EUB33202.1 phage regulatory protein Rha [Fusobacterium sp. OBRC1]WRL72557.1 Rha family transcriptional regulator [Fusobacterium polymorphum]DAI15764.1 MAG TPA: regulatory protein [Caudoviricetes sp.]
MQLTTVTQMTSLEVAEITGKEHKSVLRDIRDEIEKLTSQGIFTEHIFVPSEYQDRTGRTLPMYVLTREGVLQLAARYDAVVRFKLIEKVSHPTKVLSPVQQLLAQAQILVEMDSRVGAVEQGVRRLEHNCRRTITSNQLTVIAYANMKGIRPDEYNSSAIGRKATKLCKERNVLVGKVVDSRYGLINTYPEEILDEIFFE